MQRRLTVSCELRNANAIRENPSSRAFIERHFTAIARNGGRKGNGLQRLRSFVINNGLRVHADLGINAAHAHSNILLTLIARHQVLERREQIRCRSRSLGALHRQLPGSAIVGNRRRFCIRERTPRQQRKAQQARKQSTTLQKAEGGGLSAAKRSRSLPLPFA